MSTSYKFIVRTSSQREGADFSIHSSQRVNKARWNNHPFGRLMRQRAREPQKINRTGFLSF